MATEQTPINSGFTAASTASEVLQGTNLEGKTVIVTGAGSGLGLETAKELAKAGAHVIAAVHNREKAIKVLKGKKNIKIETIELTCPNSINEFAEEFLSTNSKLDILINVAGIMAAPLKRDSRGNEYHFSTNHLGHFQLTINLLPALLKANGARVVQVSSWAHRYSPINILDPNFKQRKYDRWQGYGQSKTANILFAYELDKRFAKDGIRAFSVHPGGIVETGLAKYISVEELQGAGAVDEKGNAIIAPESGLKNVEQGAATIVWCATSPQLEGKGGVYCEDVDIAPIADSLFKNKNIENVAEGSGVKGGVMSYAIDPEASQLLWELSEKLLPISLEAH